tara:strand:- start:116 stop:403 length:288 start_codon:yes stop_codon:yes gene_type:complete
MENQMEQNPELERNPEPELSYEEEQLQQLLIQESEKHKIQMDRELRESQEREYQESLKKDLVNLKKEEEINPWVNFVEVSIEEMRATRLKRFEKG